MKNKKGSANRKGEKGTEKVEEQDMKKRVNDKEREYEQKKKMKKKGKKRKD